MALAIEGVESVDEGEKGQEMDNKSSLSDNV